MKTVLAASLLLLAAVPASSQPSQAMRLHHRLADLEHLVDNLSQEATRNAQILNHLHQADRALDDFQENKAVAVALRQVNDAIRIAGQRPPADDAIQLPLAEARRLLEAAEESPSSTNLPKLRGELRTGPIEAIRNVVSGNMRDLAEITSKTAAITAVLSKALAEAGKSVVGKK